MTRPKRELSPTTTRHSATDVQAHGENTISLDSKATTTSPGSDSTPSGAQRSTLTTKVSPVDDNDGIVRVPRALVTNTSVAFKFWPLSVTKQPSLLQLPGDTKLEYSTGPLRVPDMSHGYADDTMPDEFTTTLPAAYGNADVHVISDPTPEAVTHVTLHGHVVAGTDGPTTTTDGALCCPHSCDDALHAATAHDDRKDAEQPTQACPKFTPDIRNTRPVLLPGSTTHTAQHTPHATRLCPTLTQ